MIYKKNFSNKLIYKEGTNYTIIIALLYYLNSIVAININFIRFQTIAGQAYQKQEQSLLFMNHLFVLIVILITFGGRALQAQNLRVVTGDIGGTVFEKTAENDKEVEYPVYMVNVCLLLPKDSSVVKFATSDEKGNFLIKAAAPGDYLLSLSAMGYSKLYLKITKDDFRKESIALGRVQMAASPIELAGITVTASPPEVVVKEDTLEYNPSAFRMQESSVVEDLLKRLPGVEVEADGKVSVAGKEVKRIYVDGKEFFGNDPKIATKNLTVDVIDKVQVVEKKSDLSQLTGIDDGERETVINLTIKEGMKKGWLGNITAGAGTPLKQQEGQKQQYTANGMVSRFRDSDQLALVYHSNNTGKDGGQGISTSNTVGLNATKEMSDKLKLNGNVRYNYAERFSKSNSFRQNLLIDSVSYRRDARSNQSYSHNLGFDTKVEYKPDTLNTFVFSSRFSYNNSRTHNQSEQSTMAGDADSTRVNASTAGLRNMVEGWTLGTELTWSRRFAKNGRRLNFTGRIDWNRNTTGGENLSVSEFYFQPDRNKYLNQDLNANTHNDAYFFRASYVEPLGTGNTLQLSYTMRYNATSNIRKTYDYDSGTGTYSILNPDYSKSLDNDFTNQIVSLTFNAIRPKYSYTAGINIVPSYTQSTSFIKDGESTGNDSLLNRIDGRRVVNYVPQASFRYRIDERTSLNFNYRGNTRQPDVSQLDPTPNVTNPLNIRTGNPDLLPAFSNMISFGLNNYRRETQRSFVVNADFSFTMNEIVNFTEYEAVTGIQHTRPINENGSWNGAANVMYNFPVGSAKKLRLSTQTRVNYNNRIGYTMVNKRSERNISGTTGISGNLGISYNNGWFYGQFRGLALYSNTANSLEGKKDQQNYNFGVNYNTQLYLPANWILASDVNYAASRGLSSGYNRNEVLWNASLSKQFLKKKQASIILQWNDILQQRQNIRRNVTANYIEDSEYNSLTSYVMITFSYRFNTMGRQAAKGARQATNGFREQEPKERGR